MKVLGIDPGSTGALALYDGDNLQIEDVPTIEVKVNKKLKTVINVPALADIFNVMFSGADHAYIEQVGAMPGQGVTSMFNFGKSAGILEMGIACCGIPYTLIHPIKWKSELGLNNDAGKSLLRANQLLPRYAEYFKRKKDHNRAEAALLAWYGHRKQMNLKVEMPK